MRPNEVPGLSRTLQALSFSFSTTTQEMPFKHFSRLHRNVNKWTVPKVSILSHRGNLFIYLFIFLANCLPKNFSCFVYLWIYFPVAFKNTFDERRTYRRRSRGRIGRLSQGCDGLQRETRRARHARHGRQTGSVTGRSVLWKVAKVCPKSR